MSLNIFIDVDGTLLNNNEGVDPSAEEILRQIRRMLDAEYPDSGLYLWSGAGGDYARSKAEEHGLAGFFSGFAGKPDVIIDDNPSSVFPRRAIVWKDHSQWQNLLPSLFTQLSPSRELAELVGQIIANVQITDDQYQALYRPGLLRYPLPFFGDLENAELITIGVNPSSTEFEAVRGWNQNMTSAQIAFRLVNYFRLWNPPPHAWFTSLETKLRLNGYSYYFNAAHLDLSPRATRAMRTFIGNPETFLNMVSRDADEWLPLVLRLARNKKAKAVCFHNGIVSSGGWQQLDNYIHANLSQVWEELLRFEHLNICAR
jgi:hypothetical protein